MSNWTRKEVLDKIQTIDPWKNSKTGERAPHKPLLILYAMGQLLCEGKKHIRFAEFCDPFAHLLEEFARHGGPITPSIRSGISVRMRSGRSTRKTVGD